MGKIDKEKLLKELTDWHVPEQIINIVEAVPEDPEEQEIDFDALYKDLLKDCGDSCTKDESCKACVFDFLKSKNLTVPKLVEIPVKKTWTLKKEYQEYHLKMCIGTMVDVKVDEEPKYPEYYDQHEESDYSKIPEGSIVEIECLGDKFYRTFVKFEHENIFTKDGGEIEQWSPNVNLRIVELAKE